MGYLQKYVKTFLALTQNLCKDIAFKISLYVKYSLKSLKMNKPRAVMINITL